MALINKLKAIGDAIRAKTGKTDELTLDQMVTEIDGITTGGDSEEWIGDGNTHIWITLHEGRTSPMLGVCPKGTVTVDWGDGTTPDVLTGTNTSTVKWTPTHNYAEPGDYVITLTVDGEMGFSGTSSSNQYACILRHSSGTDRRNLLYQNAVRKVEISSGVKSIGNYAFSYCRLLTSIVIPESVKSIGNYSFQYCNTLASIVIPESVKSIGMYSFQYCNTLASVVIPESVTSIGGSAFANCAALLSAVYPKSVPSLETAFTGCVTLKSIIIPEGVTRIGGDAFRNCNTLSSIVIPESVMSIGSNAFYGCYGMRYFDFTKHTAVPTSVSTDAFSSISDDCEIRVPATLYDEWIAATNWTTLASKIVAV